MLEDQRRYIVQATPGKFVKTAGDDFIDVTVMPSRARSTADYGLAIWLVDRLQRCGYSHSCVCDVRGNPLRPLSRPQIREEERPRSNKAKRRKRKKAKASEESTMEKAIKAFLASDRSKSFIEWARDLAEESDEHSL